MLPNDLSICLSLSLSLSPLSFERSCEKSWLPYETPHGIGLREHARLQNVWMCVVPEVAECVSSDSSLLALSRDCRVHSKLKVCGVPK